ncbi:hypothetical protein ACE1SV_73950 [Streptomyces sennicomposti]
MEEGRRLPRISRTAKDAVRLRRAIERHRPPRPWRTERRIGAYVRWRNARAEPKTSSAPDSPVRTWTECPAEAA